MTAPNGRVGSWPAMAMPCESSPGSHGARRDALPGLGGCVDSGAGLGVHGSWVQLVVARRSYQDSPVSP